MRNGSRAMKRLLFLGVGSALMFTMGGIGSAQADNGPHSITTGTVNIAGGIIATNVADAQVGAQQCASCHRAHTAQASDLLKQAQPALCLNCHDGTGSSLDVENGTSTGNTGQAKGALRGGGFTTAEIGSGAATKVVGPMSNGRYPVSGQVIPVGAPGQKVTSEHQIDGQATGTMWGNGTPTSAGTSEVGPTGVVLECGACHDPHGNGNYRILKADPDGSNYVTSSPGAASVTTSPTTTVNIPDQPCTGTTSRADVCLKAYTTVNYWDVQAVGVPATLNGVALPPISAAVGTKAAVYDTDGFLGNISAWCTTCHTRYLSPSGGGTTATSDKVFTYKHRSDEGASSKPNCIQCHVAHGTDSVMNTAAGGVTAPGAGAGSSTAGYENSDLLRVDDRGTCLMCHTMGAPTTTP